MIVQQGDTLIIKRNIVRFFTVEDALNKQAYTEYEVLSVDDKFKEFITLRVKPHVVS